MSINVKTITARQNLAMRINENIYVTLSDTLGPAGPMIGAPGAAERPGSPLRPGNPGDPLLPCLPESPVMNTWSNIVKQHKYKYYFADFISAVKHLRQNVKVSDKWISRRCNSMIKSLICNVYM